CARNTEIARCKIAPCWVMVLIEGGILLGIKFGAVRHFLDIQSVGISIRLNSLPDKDYNQ
ncbi:hypothetical protein, partial [Yersinia pestis]